MFAVAVRSTMGQTLQDMPVYVSDDESVLDKSEESPNPAAGTMQRLTPVSDVDAVEPFAVVRLWAAQQYELSTLPFIRRIVGTVDDRAGLVTVLEERLTVAGIDRFEVALGMRGVNGGQPRSRFLT